tara:strand:+ start:135 stop:572 length:438 start_codon:yes stop_codon:yes gene_type:complete
MKMQQETQMKPSHEERKTEIYRIGDAIRELENDLAHQRQFPCRHNGERTDLIQIHTGFNSPSLNINKAQCVKWMREHFKSGRRTQPSEHWAKEGQLYVSLTRSRYWVWVSCGENRFRTEESAAGMQAGEDARDKAFALITKGEEE